MYRIFYFVFNCFQLTLYLSIFHVLKDCKFMYFIIFHYMSLSKHLNILLFLNNSDKYGLRENEVQHMSSTSVQNDHFLIFTFFHTHLPNPRILTNLRSVLIVRKVKAVENELYGTKLTYLHPPVIALKITFALFINFFLFPHI